jgi:hypothetical protein
MGDAETVGVVQHVPVIKITPQSTIAFVIFTIARNGFTQ